MQKILIIGATSAIATATARRFASRGDSLYLLARNEELLKDMASDLEIRGANRVAYAPFEANDFKQHPAIIDAAIQSLDGIDVVLIAYGTLGDQETCEKSFDLTLQELNTNAISVISLLTHLANYFENQGHGNIIVISSVAGDRGRQSNYIYGTAKGAISIFLQGLRNRLHKNGVHVMTVKPGFVDTPMTADLKKGVLWVSPKVIAQGIENALAKKKDVVYLPAWWRLIMYIITSIPETYFKKTSL